MKVNLINSLKLLAEEVFKDLDLENG